MTFTKLPTLLKEKIRKVALLFTSPHLFYRRTCTILTISMFSPPSHFNHLYPSFIEESFHLSTWWHIFSFFILVFRFSRLPSASFLIIFSWFSIQLSVLDYLLNGLIVQSKVLLYLLSFPTWISATVIINNGYYLHWLCYIFTTCICLLWVCEKMNTWPRLSLYLWGI